MTSHYSKVLVWKKRSLIARAARISQLLCVISPQPDEEMFGSPVTGECFQEGSRKKKDEVDEVKTTFLENPCEL